MQAADNSGGLTPRYVWDCDRLLPGEGEVEVTIGDLLIRLDLRFPHERRYALGFLYGFRNPQADIDRALFQKYVRRGDCILDAGANIGVTAAEALACGADHVVCVEPEHALVGRLKSLKLCSRGRMSVWDCALGAGGGSAQLLLSQGHNQGHTISPRMVSLFPNLFDKTVERVEVTTVDLILAERSATLWKLDVEGMEADVIRGARQTLERSPPHTIFAELYDPFVDEFLELLPGFQVRRAALTKKDYALHLFDQIGGPLTDEFCPISPTYVCTRDD